MDYRQLGRSGLRISTLTLGTMTFGGGGPFAAVGAVDLDGARRHIDLCLDAGVNLIDTADVYSSGLSEELVGQALVGRRDRALLATKARMPMGEGPNDAGLSRHHLIEACEAEYELVPAALDQGLGTLVWSPLAGGLLSGKYRRDAQPEEGRQLTDWDEPPVRDQEVLYDIVDALVEIGDAHGVSAAQVALAYTLGRPGVTSVVIGARKEEQLIDNLAAADLALSADERARLDAISAPPLLYPYWHQAKTAADRLSAADLALLGPHLD